MSNIYMEYLTESEREKLILEKEIDLINSDIDYLFNIYESADSRVMNNKKINFINKFNIQMNKLFESFGKQCMRLIEKIEKIINKFVESLEKFKENRSNVPMNKMKYKGLQEIKKIIPRFDRLVHKYNNGLMTKYRPIDLKDEIEQLTNTIKNISFSDTDNVDTTIIQVKYSEYKSYKTLLDNIKNELKILKNDSEIYEDKIWDDDQATREKYNILYSTTVSLISLYETLITALNMVLF